MKKPQLFLLHFAGGNRYSFQFMAGLLTDFDVFPLELPGRGRRVNERLLTDFDLAARDMYDQITTCLSHSGFMIYGHSMGAYLGLRVAGMLEKEGKNPAALVVSGNAGPGIGKPKATYLLGRQEFIEKVEALGGMPSELADNKELLEFFEPILRADFRIAEQSTLAAEPAVKCPLFAIMGSKEEQAAEISNWSRFTLSGFSHEILEGDHFFIHKHPARIAGIIKSSYYKVALPR